MRRKDREITDRGRIEDIISRCGVCHIALMDGEVPYIVPMSVGYVREGDAFSLYFHCAREGKKLDLLRQNPNAAFSMETGYRVISAKNACAYSANYESVIGRGKLLELTGEETVLGLRAVMRQCGAPEGIALTEAMTKAVVVLKLAVEEIYGKANV